MAHVSDRGQNVCGECKRRKVGCDKVRPECSRCRDSRVRCVYESKTPRRQFAFVYETKQVAPERSSEEVPSATVPIPVEKLQYIEDRAVRLAHMAQNINHAANIVKHESPIRSTDRTGQIANQLDGRLRYIEKSLVVSMRQEISELDQLLTGRNRCNRSSGDGSQSCSISPSPMQDAADILSRMTPNTELDTATEASSSTQHRLTSESLMDAPIWSEHQDRSNRFHYRQPSIISQLPPRNHCDLLVNSYIEGFHPLAPLIHLPTFRQSYDHLWQNLGQAKNPASSSFLALVLAIVFAGSVSCPPKTIQAAFPLKTHEETAAALRERAIQAIRSSDFPSSPTIDSFAAYLICQGVWMREEEPLNCCAFIGLSFRMAQMLGLHRDPQHFKSLDPISAEVRRRIWWHVVHLDVSIAVASGLPPIIDLHCWDVQKPTELKDEAIGTPDGLQYDRSVAAGNRVRDSADDPEDVNGHSMVSTGGVLAGGKFSSTYLMRKALSKLCARTSPSVEDQSDMRAWFRNMSEDLAARIERIPQGPSNRRSGSVRQPDDVIEYRMRLNKWARLLLSGFIDRNWTVICHPILKTSLQQGLPNVYEQGLNHCIMFLKKATHLACIPDFRHFQWSWPGIHQPVQPLTIVLQDLIERPVSPIAELARRYIDIAFVLLRPSEGLRGGEEDASMPRPPSEGSAETWEYLGRLRSTAWSNAGIDPSMFCTWQAATAYCLLDQEVGDGAASVSTSTGFSESLLDPAIFPTDTMVAGQDFTNEMSGFGSMDMYPARWYDGLNELNVDAVGIGLQ